MRQKDVKAVEGVATVILGAFVATTCPLFLPLIALGAICHDRKKKRR